MDESAKVARNKLATKRNKQLHIIINRLERDPTSVVALSDFVVLAKSVRLLLKEL